ncbi:acidic leucine-rich nuclear phosphoprotein 32 family member B-like [Capsicum galapagoense]
MLPAEEPVPGNGRKRLRTDEEEDGNANKLRNEEQEEEGEKVVDEQNGNLENTNGDEHKKEDDENEEAEDGKRKKREKQNNWMKENRKNLEGIKIGIEDEKEDTYYWMKMTMMKKKTDRMLDQKIIQIIKILNKMKVEIKNQKEMKAKKMMIIKKKMMTKMKKKRTKKKEEEELLKKENIQCLKHAHWNLSCMNLTIWYKENRLKHLKENKLLIILMMIIGICRF